LGSARESAALPIAELIAEIEAFDVLIVDTEAFDFVSMCFDRRDRNFIQDEEERG
jgi:hypothetical protein